jgi:hypothetical protein
MNEDYLKTRLMEFFQGHRGRAQTIRRERVLDYLRKFEPGIDDRKLRKLYSSLPICSCPEGLFLPKSGEEVEEFRMYLSKAWGPIVADRRVKLIYAFYPSLRPGYHQPDLFSRRQEESEIKALGLGD